MLVHKFVPNLRIHLLSSPEGLICALRADLPSVEAKATVQHPAMEEVLVGELIETLAQLAGTVAAEAAA